MVAGDRNIDPDLAFLLRHHRPGCVAYEVLPAVVASESAGCIKLFEEIDNNEPE